ncbi:uncharacterized protein LOC118406535 [Branchiostoma floridae]|uniref:Uncharacterized protein LOC118406535 n=1 Tax=Branchiostoma floridae TaxID=7739 RepID=A0A9J7HQB9_BRAFL|nr:uncharacterized protein LOC118406535 [Branchiostoma floridae]
MAERLAYYQRREAARKEPEKYLSLIVDGMDQAKTYLPHFVGDKSKDLTTADQMKVHVSGVISHGHGLRTTYIQLSFLFVGHTHEDIDQMFSRVADKLRHQEAHTPEQLINMMPECSRLRGLYNIRDWLKPSIPTIQGQSQPGQFRFRLSKEDPDVVDMFYRKGQGQPWNKLKNGMFKRSESGKPDRPKGVPKIIPVSFENRNINAQKLLDEQLPKWLPYLDSDQEQFVWKNYLGQMIKSGKSATALAAYSKVGTGWVLTKLPQYVEQNCDDEESAVPGDVRALLEKEQENPEVTDT